MVRILEIKKLEERRRLLVMRGEIYRQTLRLELAGLKYSTLELKQRFGLLRTVRRYLGMTAFLARFFNQRRNAENGKGFVARLFSGVKFAAAFAPWLKTFRGKRARDGSVDPR